MNDLERVNELNNKINMLLAQSNNIDNPYTDSEYRALLHQIDRLTIKRDLMQDRVNLHYKKYNKEDIKLFKIILLFIIYLYIMLILFILSL